MSETEHKPWCASVPHEFDVKLGRGPYPCDCNADAIAAERENTFDWAISMQCKLAAERKRYDDLQRSVMDLSHPNCKVLLKERNEAQKQLAAERIIKEAEKLILLDEVSKNKQLREQLATAVEALNKIAEYECFDTCSEPAGLAKAALAKLKDGK